jgi:hypothetical protein
MRICFEVLTEAAFKTLIMKLLEEQRQTMKVSHKEFAVNVEGANT